MEAGSEVAQRGADAGADAIRGAAVAMRDHAVLGALRGPRHLGPSCGQQALVFLSGRKLCSPHPHAFTASSPFDAAHAWQRCAAARATPASSAIQLHLGVSTFLCSEVEETAVEDIVTGDEVETEKAPCSLSHLIDPAQALQAAQRLYEAPGPGLCHSGWEGWTVDRKRAAARRGKCAEDTDAEDSND